MQIGRVFRSGVLLFAMAILAACQPPPVGQRLQTARTSSDQSELGDLAAGDADARVRDTALARLTDERELARVAESDLATDLERQVAFAKVISYETVLHVRDKTPSQTLRWAAAFRLDQLPWMYAAENAQTTSGERHNAIGLLKDPALLAHAFFSIEAEPNPEAYLAEAAISRLNDPNALYRIAVEAKTLKFRLQAISRLKDQTLLKFLVAHQKAAAIRLAAAANIKDDRFLFDLSRNDPSNSVRSGAVEVMTDQALLARVVMENDGTAQRYAAAGRLTDHALIAQATRSVDNIKREVHQLSKSNDVKALVQTAVSGRFDVLRVAASLRLTDQSALAEVAISSRDRQVNRVVFAKLSDKAALVRVAGQAALSSMRLAARVKLGQANWIAVFKRAAASDSRSEAFGEALAAVDLFSVQTDAKNAIVEACLDFIRRGDESRIPELIEMLKQYGDVDLAEDYLNCGQPDLEGAATAWARKHGYSVGSGYGSHRATWGSD